MKSVIDLKRVGPKAHVRTLIEELISRLQERLHHFPQDAVSVHVLFEENGAHTVSRTCLTCHVPGHTVAAQEESRAPGASIREAFAELERQLDKLKTKLRHEQLRKHSARRRRIPGTLPRLTSEPGP